jgi:hypothetical protein
MYYFGKNIFDIIQIPDSLKYHDAQWKSENFSTHY